MVALLLLALANAALAKVFSPNEDLLAFPQYKIVFSDNFILDTDAESSLALASSAASSKPSEPSAIATQNQHGERKAEETYEYMMLGSTPYLCSLPIITEQKNETEAPRSKEDELAELAKATYRGQELLNTMDQCLYFTSGWWSYAMCPNRSVKQFHALPATKGSAQKGVPLEDESVPSFTLGSFPDSLKKTPEQKGKSRSSNELARAQSRGDMRFMTQTLYGGTICDITSRPRQIEVQYHCHPETTDRIGLVKEIATCSYLMVVYTSRLCDAVEFEPSQQHTQVHQVTCKAILQESEVERWRSSKIHEIGESTGKKTTATHIGGIELGGKKLTEATIPAGKVHIEDDVGQIIVQWSKELGLKSMTDAQLSEMELDQELVREMTETLSNLAGGHPFSLRVVDGEQGRELRGVVDDEDESEDVMDPGSEDGDAGSSSNGETHPKDEL